MKKKEKKGTCIRIGRARLYIYFCIRATVKLFEKKGVLHFILVAELQLNCKEKKWCYKESLP